MFIKFESQKVYKVWISHILVYHFMNFFAFHFLIHYSLIIMRAYAKFIIQNLRFVRSGVNFFQILSQ
jgi:hypothetical protein